MFVFLLKIGVWVEKLELVDLAVFWWRAGELKVKSMFLVYRNCLG